LLFYIFIRRDQGYTRSAPQPRLQQKKVHAMATARETVQDFKKGMSILAAEMPETIPAMAGFMGAAAKDGALTYREKELVAIGVALYTRCPECIAVHCQKALEAGCTRAEILEAAGMAMVFGGGPVLGSSATLLLECLDEFGGK
jgi:AhpD family alkylhydroperoxidase